VQKAADRTLHSDRQLVLACKNTLLLVHVRISASLSCASVQYASHQARSSCRARQLPRCTRQMHPAAPHAAQPRAAAAGRARVAVYRGEGAGWRSVQSAVASISRLLPPDRFLVDTMATRELLAGGWQARVALLVMPGGADLPYCKHLNGAGNALIRGAGGLVFARGPAITCKGSGCGGAAQPQLRRAAAGGLVGMPNHPTTRPSICNQQGPWPMSGQTAGVIQHCALAASTRLVVSQGAAGQRPTAAALCAPLYETSRLPLVSPQTISAAAAATWGSVRAPTMHAPA
jgi:hypothetical protein